MKKDYLIRRLSLSLFCLFGMVLSLSAQTDKWTTLVHQKFDQFTAGSHTNPGDPDPACLISKDTKIEGFDMTRSANIYQAGGAILFGSKLEEAAMFTIPMNFLGDEVRITLKAKADANMKFLTLQYDKEGAEREKIFIEGLVDGDFKDVVATIPASDSKCALKLCTRSQGFFVTDFPRIFIKEIKIEIKNQQTPTADASLIIKPRSILFEDRNVGVKSYEREIDIKGVNLTEVPTYQLVNDNEKDATFTVKGDLTQEGGKLIAYVKHLKPGIHTAKILVKYKDTVEEILLKGRARGGNPVEGLDTSKPVTSVDEKFESRTLPKGWNTFIAGGYEDWKYQPSMLNDKNYVATMNADTTNWDSASAYLISPCMAGKKNHVGVINFDFVMKPKTQLFMSTFFSVHILRPDGTTTEKPLFAVDYSKIEDYKTIQSISLETPEDIVKDNFFVGFLYTGATTASYSTAVEVDNVKISLKDVTGVEAIQNDAQVWRSANEIGFANLDGALLEVYTIDGNRVMVIPEAYNGTIGLGTNDRVLVRYANQSIVL